jgi:hypothetical protein
LDWIDGSPLQAPPDAEALSQAAEFLRRINDPPPELSRTALWIPFFAAKWAVILLNPALDFSLAGLPPIQLEKARAVLARGAEFLK